MRTSPSRRDLLIGLAASLALAACAAPTRAVPPASTPVTAPTAAPVPPTAQPAAPPAAPAPAPLPTDLGPGEQVVRDYFRLLGTSPAAARALLTPEWLARSGQAQAAPTPQAVEVVSLQTVRQGEGRAEYGLELRAGGAAAGSPWSAGLNYRFVLVIETAMGWRIAEIASSPISDAGALAVTPTSGFTRQGGRQLGATFEVPTGWVKDPDVWVFRPAPDAPVAVGVVRSSAHDPTALLPSHSQLLGADPVDLGWAKGTRYTLRRVAPTAGGAATGYEVHIVASLAGKATYSLFSTAGDEQSSIRLADQARTRVVQSFALVGG
jgi:hypothetical protein